MNNEEDMKTRFEEAVATGAICPDLFAEWIPYLERLNQIDRCYKNGEYRDSYLQGPWFIWKESWKASRDALCVEIPHESSIFWHQDVCEALDDAGVHYK